MVFNLTNDLHHITSTITLPPRKLFSALCPTAVTVCPFPSERLCWNLCNMKTSETQALNSYQTTNRASTNQCLVLHCTERNSEALLMDKWGFKNTVFLPLFVFHAHLDTHKQKHKQPVSDTRLVHSVPLSYFCLQDKGFYLLLKDDRVCAGVCLSVCVCVCVCVLAG